jgi:Ca-activated chloride channel family protein
MTFIWPAMLVSLVLIPLSVVLYLKRLQRRRRLAASYGNLGFARGAMGRGPGASRHIPPVLLLVGLTVLLVALARPQTVVSLPKEEGTVILAFDASGSMAADDLKPTRIEAASRCAGLCAAPATQRADWRCRFQR